jgi:3-methylfumaryl-CoA hydratase
MTMPPSRPAVLTMEDVVEPARVQALAGVLDRDLAGLTAGQTLPPMWQLAFFLPYPAQRDIGPDGHPVVGFPLPPQPGLRRMFAGGRLRMHPGLRIGDRASAESSIVSERDREGRSGKLHLVTTRTVYSVAGSPVLTEERDIVYLYSAPAAPAPLPSGPPVPPVGAAVRTVDVDPTLLFRFSALTYNSHRIHYDRDYARDVEGYPGLVVHGPLQALLMADVGRTLDVAGQTPTTIDYRLIAPLFEGQGLAVVADPGTDDEGPVITVAVQDHSGRRTARATLR